MQNTAEKLTATTHENMEALQGLSTQANDDAAKLVALNLATTKNLMTASFEFAKDLAAAKDPQAWASL